MTQQLCLALHENRGTDFIHNLVVRSRSTNKFSPVVAYERTCTLYKKRTILIHTDVNHTTKCSQRPADVNHTTLIITNFVWNVFRNQHCHTHHGVLGDWWQHKTTQRSPMRPCYFKASTHTDTHSHARPNRWYVCLNRDAHVSTYHGAHKHTEFGRDAGSIRRQYLFILENNQSKTWAANDRRKQCQPVSPLITSLIPHTKSMHQVKIHKWLVEPY